MQKILQALHPNKNTQLNQHVSNDTSTPSQEEHADALGVQSRGGDRGNQYQSGNPSNEGMAPSAKGHADALGVSTPVSNP